MRRALTILYYGLFVPLGPVYRLFSRRARELGIDPRARSYWSESRPYTDLRRPR